MAIVIVIGKDEDRTPEYFGPFVDGDAASRWGFDNCQSQGFDWHWEVLNVVETE